MNNCSKIILVLDTSYIGARRNFRDLYEKCYSFVIKQRNPFPQKLIIVSKVDPKKFSTYVNHMFSADDLKAIGLPVARNQKANDFMNSFISLLKSNYSIVNPANGPTTLKNFGKHTLKKNYHFIFPFAGQQLEEIFPEVLKGTNSFNFWHLVYGDLNTVKFGFILIKSVFIPNKILDRYINIHARSGADYYIGEEKYNDDIVINEIIKKLRKTKNENSLQVFEVYSTLNDLNRNISYYLFKSHPYLYEFLRKYDLSIQRGIINEILPDIMAYEFQSSHPNDMVEKTSILIRLILYIKETAKQFKSFSEQLLHAEVVFFNDSNDKARKLLENKTGNFTKVIGNLIYFIIKNKPSYSRRTIREYLIHHLVEIITTDDEDNDNLHIDYFKHAFIECFEEMIKKNYPIFASKITCSNESYFRRDDWVRFFIEIYTFNFMKKKSINDPKEAIETIYIIMLDQKYRTENIPTKMIYEHLSGIFGISPVSIKQRIARKLGQQSNIVGNIFEFLLN